MQRARNVCKGANGVFISLAIVLTTQLTVKLASRAAFLADLHTGIILATCMQRCSAE